MKRTGVRNEMDTFEVVFWVVVVACALAFAAGSSTKDTDDGDRDNNAD
jgi:hypothetical protein